MRSGLRPIHSVETITWTSEISGTASSGVRVMAQIPDNVRTTVPVKTRNRFDAHQSIIFSIIIWLSQGPTPATCASRPLVARQWLRQRSAYIDVHLCCRCCGAKPCEGADWLFAWPREKAEGNARG